MLKEMKRWCALLVGWSTEVPGLTLGIFFKEFGMEFNYLIRTTSEHL